MILMHQQGVTGVNNIKGCCIGAVMVGKIGGSNRHQSRNCELLPAQYGVHCFILEETASQILLPERQYERVSVNEQASKQASQLIELSLKAFPLPILLKDRGDIWDLHRSQTLDCQEIISISPSLCPFTNRGAGNCCIYILHDPNSTISSRGLK